MEIDDASKKNAKSLLNTPNDTVAGDNNKSPPNSETPAPPNARAEKTPSSASAASASVPKIKCDRCGEVFKLGEQVGHRETCPKNNNDDNKKGSLECDDCGKKFGGRAGKAKLTMHREAIQ